MPLERPRNEVAAAVRSVIEFGPIQTQDEQLLMRALAIYERHRIDFAEAYLAAVAEQNGGQVASFDRGLDRVPGVQRIQP